MNKQNIEDFTSLLLDSYSFEELLEEFDLTPEQVMVRLFYQGLIEEEHFEKLVGLK